MGKKLLWVLDFTSNRHVPSPELSPEIPEAMVVVADSHFVVVEGSHDEVESMIHDYPYWRNSGHPADGLWRSAGGDEICIAGGEVVDSELDVLRALGVEITEYAEQYPYDVLEALGKVF